jgi:hypothetical protein
MKVREVEFDEVLPKGARTSAKDDPFIAFVAQLMDDQFVVPGTNLRFGLDPLLGLLPGWGDSASAFVSALLVLQSARTGVPKVILARMVLNILINAVGGALPGVGDAFSFWFKSNARNLSLHQRHAGTAHRVTPRDWLFVGALLGGMLALIILFFLATFGLALQALHWIFGAR